MEEEKEFRAKGFLLYTDDEDFFRDLDDDEAGQLIKALFRYFNRGEMPKDMPKIIKMPFNVIRKEIDRDVSKYVADVKGKSDRRKKQWADRKKLEEIANSSMQVHADAYSSMETKTQTKTKAKAQTRALAKTKTIADADVPPLEGRTSSSVYGTSDGNSQFHADIEKMLKDRENGVEDSYARKRAKREADGFFQMTAEEKWAYLEEEKRREES